MFQLQRSDALISIEIENMPESLFDKVVRGVVESLPADLDLFLKGDGRVIVTINPNGREGGISKPE